MIAAPYSHVKYGLGAGYGGEYGGQALADVLAGDYNPGGALTYTVLPQSYTAIALFTDLSMRPRPATGYPGRTYKFIDEDLVKPLWRFGYGLSYTTFKLTFAHNAAHPAPSVLAPNEDAQWVARLTNTGPVEGGCVVVCYASAIKQAAVKQPPIRAVFDFERVESLLPGTSTLLAFNMTARGRALVDEQGAWVTPAGTYEATCEAGGVEVIKSPFSVKASRD